MEFKELRYGYTVSTAHCVREVISPLQFFSQEARTKEIEKFNSDNLWAFVENKHRCNIVAIDNGEVVGFLFGVVDANVMWVLWIGMKEKHRRLDHMRTLWEMMEDWCRTKGISKVWCDTNQLNTPSIQFVQKLGYTKLADLTNYWYGHDYFLWEKTLNGKNY
tara:strand:+ start:63 stop:548 length:486 start_codon:yes stop_codon:yes gene_type:complete